MCIQDCVKRCELTFFESDLLKKFYALRLKAASLNSGRFAGGKGSYAGTGVICYPLSSPTGLGLHCYAHSYFRPKDENGNRLRGEPGSPGSPGESKTLRQITVVITGVRSLSFDCTRLFAGFTSHPCK